MDFTGILNYVVPIIITPFVVEFIKTRLNIQIPFVSYVGVVVVSVGFALGYWYIMQVPMPIDEAIGIALNVALASIGLKAGWKTYQQNKSGVTNGNSQ